MMTVALDGALTEMVSAEDFEGLAVLLCKLEGLRLPRREVAT